MKLPNNKPALTASFIVAFLFTLLTITVSTVVWDVHISKEDQEKAATMNYVDGVSYLIEKTTNVSRLDSITNAVQFPEFWVGALGRLSGNFFLCLMACGLYNRLTKSNKALQPIADASAE